MHIILYPVQFIAIAVFVSIAFFTGLKLSKLSKKYWVVSYLLALLVIMSIVASRHFRQLVFIAPFSWIMAGRVEFIVISAAAALLLGVLIPRLEQRNLKVSLCFLLFIFCGYNIAVPFLLPVFIRGKMERTENSYVSDGVCLQSTGYTCGPASAVTFLSQFGINANEGELAILAYTTPQLGTSEDLLVTAINKAHSKNGFRCEYIFIDTIKELKEHCPAIAVIKYSLLADHYITVLEVAENQVIVGNPLSGKETLTYQQFLDKWRSAAIVSKKNVE